MKDHAPRNWASPPPPPPGPGAQPKFGWAAKALAQLDETLADVAKNFASEVASAAQQEQATRVAEQQNVVVGAENLQPFGWGGRREGGIEEAVGEFLSTGDESAAVRRSLLVVAEESEDATESKVAEGGAAKGGRRGEFRDSCGRRIVAGGMVHIHRFKGHPQIVENPDCG